MEELLKEIFEEQEETLDFKDSNFEESLYCLYKHTNIFNEKVYYGIAQDYLIRWNDGKGYMNNIDFWNDIIYYGWSNFKHEIIYENLKKEQALELEGLLIQETKSYLPENGYNQNFRNIDFQNITLDENREQIENFKSPRKGRGGQPVIYNGKYFESIKILSSAKKNLFIF